MTKGGSTKMADAKTKERDGKGGQNTITNAINHQRQNPRGNEKKKREWIGPPQMSKGWVCSSALPREDGWGSIL